MQMSQPIQLSPSTSPKSPLNPQPHIHNCRWDWCRLTFPTNTFLVDHVIHEHVRTAQPVRRSDLQMLRRAEDGVGESLRFSMSDNLQTPFASGSNVHTSSQTSPHSPRPSKRARTEQPEPSSPTQTHSQSQAEVIIKPTPSTPSVPHSRPTNSTNSNTPNPSPHSPDPRPPAFSPSRRTFAQLSEGSPDSYIAPDSPPPSPSFNSQVANAVRALTSGFGFGFRGGRGARDSSPAENQNDPRATPSPSPRPRKGEERAASIRHVSLEHEQGFSQISNSQTSQERVERELTQEAGSDVEMDRDAHDAATGPVVNETSATGELITPTSTSDSRFNSTQKIVDSQSLGPGGHGDMEVDEELEWPENMVIPDSAVPIADNLRRSLSAAQPQDDSQLPVSSVLSAPVVLKTQAPSPSSLSRSADQQQHISRATSSPDRILSHPQSQSRNQSQSRLRARRSFRSGSLQVIPGPKISRQRSTSQSIGNGRNASGNVIAESQPLESQESPSESGGGGYMHSYIQLQTQAPYQSQSQSYSQSLSETSAG